MPLALFARVPRLRFRAESYPVIPPAAKTRFPDLADDLAALEQHVTPVFDARDREALALQNGYRGLQLLILLTSSLLTALGGLQAIWPGERWPGLLLAGLGVVLAALTHWAGERDGLDEFLTARLKAERLRALHFQYLARLGPYGLPDRVAGLRKAVLAIDAGREPR